MSFITHSLYADVAHLVERHLAKVEVASSSLVIRSKKEPTFVYDKCGFFLTKCALGHDKHTSCVKHAFGK